MSGWQRINRNSPAQVMRARERLVFLARPLVTVFDLTTPSGSRLIPARYGHTYNAGRNKAKRAKRARRPA